MRFLAFALMAISAVFTTVRHASAQATQVLTPPGAEENANAASYGMGFQIGQQVASGGISAADIKQSEMLRGFMDALAGKKPAYEQEVLAKSAQALFNKVLARKLAENKKFLAENAKKDGVQTTPSGLQYRVIKSGSGASPKPESQVTVHYEGKLMDGSIFDSSIKRGQPATFGVSQVIKGWTEALLRMKVGDKWELVIPSDLAYGEQGFQGIGPNELLTFQVELLEVR